MEKVFVNRTLNLKKIKYIGFDMDHTLIRYQSQNFEELTHDVVLKKLVNDFNYPKDILDFPFEFNRVIRGLVIDRKNGNLLKLNRYSGIRSSSHGTKKIDFSTQKQIYESIYIDLGDPNYLSIDTAFSMSLGLLFAQLVDFKEGPKGNKLPTFDQISHDIETSVDAAHRDGSLKNEVKKNLAKYILTDPKTVELLERLLKHDKKMFILTNSDYPYTKMLLDFAIQPFLKDHKHWTDLFEFIITFAKKPRFFYDSLSLLKVNPENGTMTNYDAKLTKGIYQGGCAKDITASLEIGGDDILYIGDHIYGDILRLKKDCNWRTALVIEELGQEIYAMEKTKESTRKIRSLMKEKLPLENQVLDITTKNKDSGTPVDDKALQAAQEKVSAIDKKISEQITETQKSFNPHWGETMRAGAEESYFASQVERYACIYMSRLHDLLDYSPRTYFRAFRRELPHEEHVNE